MRGESPLKKVSKNLTKVLFILVRILSTTKLTIPIFYHVKSKLMLIFCLVKLKLELMFFWKNVDVFLQIIIGFASGRT